jgi:hypothetical protein
MKGRTVLLGQVFFGRAEQPQGGGDVRHCSRTPERAKRARRALPRMAARFPKHHTRPHRAASAAPARGANHCGGESRHRTLGYRAAVHPCVGCRRDRNQRGVCGDSEGYLHSGSGDCVTVPCLSALA